MTTSKITASVGSAMNGHGESGRDEPRLQRSAKSAGMDIGMRVLSYLIGGVAFYGLLGWLGDHFLGTGFLLPIGIVVGAALGLLRDHPALRCRGGGLGRAERLDRADRTADDREGAR